MIFGSDVFGEFDCSIEPFLLQGLHDDFFDVFAFLVFASVALLQQCASFHHVAGLELPIFVQDGRVA
jgi:hypothetical protein